MLFVVVVYLLYFIYKVYSFWKADFFETFDTIWLIQSLIKKDCVENNTGMLNCLKIKHFLHKGQNDDYKFLYEDLCANCIIFFLKILRFDLN